MTTTAALGASHGTAAIAATHATAAVSVASSPVPQLALNVARAVLEESHAIATLTITEAP